MPDVLQQRGVLLLSENAGVGGINSYVMLVAEGLRTRGIPVGIATVWPKPDNWLGIQCQQRGFWLRVLGKRRSLSCFPGSVYALAKMMKERHYAIVNTQAHYSGLVGRAAYLLAGKPCRIVATVHGMADDPRLGLKMFYWLDWRSFSFNRTAIANSQDTANRLLALGVKRPMASVVLHGIIAQYEAERLQRLPPLRDAAQDTPPTIGFIGRLSPEKGAKTLIEAACLLKQRGYIFRVVIVGDGPESTNLKSLVIAYGLGAEVVFEEWQVDVLPYYRRATVIAVPSVRESLGLTVLEAMLHGCTVVASRVQGIPEIVTDGQTGLLVSPQNPESLALALERCLANPGLCASLGEAGRQYVLTHHTIEDMIEQTVAVYEQALNGARP